MMETHVATTETTLDTARRYVTAGLSVVPIVGSGNKQPGVHSDLLTWGPYQKRLPTDDELARWFGPSGSEGIGIVMGAVSGHAETIDFDTKYHPLLWDDWAKLVETAAPGLVARLVVDETPGTERYGPGRHALYRCPDITIPKNQKLAETLEDPAQLVGKDNPVRGLIETRGQGGMIIVAPTPAHYHETRRPYRLLQGDYTALPVVTAEEREVMIRCAQALTRYTPPQSDPRPSRNGTTPTGNRPGDDYNARARWDDILEPKGWYFYPSRGSVTMLRRPGKKQGVSATLNYAGSDLLYVFSSNASPFEAERSYSKFGAYTELYHAGDYAEAAKKLAADGYGEQKKQADTATIRFVNQDTGKVTEAPATINTMLAALKQDPTHDAPVYAAIDALAVLPAIELAQVKTQLKRLLGKAINLNDLQRAITAAQRQAHQTRRQQGDLPVIVITDRPLRDQTADALAALGAMNENKPSLFVRAGELVRIRHDEKGRPIIDTLTADVLTHHLARSADFVKLTGDGEKHAAPPETITDDVLALGAWPFPPLEAVVEVPTLRPDGTILGTPGYDPATRLFYAPEPDLTIPPISDHPTREDVQAAIDLVDEAIGDFPYADTASRAAAYALLLTPIVRPAISGAIPAALIDAPTQGTGKSLLGECAGIITSGRSTPVMSAPNNGEEWRKQITSALVDGATFCLIDNVEGRLWAPDLARVLTSSIWRDRVLGKTQMIDLPNRAAWVVTGNNIRLGGDLPRRCFWIRLDAKTARPWQRERTTFRHPDLKDWLIANRGRLVAALLTLARAWYAANRPAGQVLELGSFEQWCVAMGGILSYAGVPDFLSNLEQMYEQSDEDGPAWEAFFETWHAILGDARLTVADLTEKIRESDDLRTVLPPYIAEHLPNDERDKDGTITKRVDAGKFKLRLGNALASKRDTYYGSYCLKQGTATRTKAKMWYIIGQDRGDAETRGDKVLLGHAFSPTHLDVLQSVEGVGVFTIASEQVSPRVSASPRGEEWEEGEI